MATVTSLGIHQPTGLRYAIQERLLPADAPSSSYTWQNHCEDSHGPSQHDDELLVTPRSVIWSRGGVFRKSYRFDIEKEPVTQALMTTFPSIGPLAARDRKSDQKSSTFNVKSPAIVVFLRTQAHVYFLSGASHVIHLPFEVEVASAAPNGLIIQRKLRYENLAAVSLKFPRVPPNSFVSSQPQPWSAASSQQSTFSIADLGTPRQLPIPTTSTLKDLWEPPAVKNDSNWPRLFSLSDPLSEMGLVGIQQVGSDGRQHGRNPKKMKSLDVAEEIIHLSRQNEFLNGDSDLTLALTLNRETSMYTVWKLSYVGSEPGKRDKQRATSGTMSRRRSSFVPGTGATTPVFNGQHSLRESFGGHQNPPVPRSTQDDLSKDKLAGLASTLELDLDNETLPRRKSRRVSSMLARADLSASHERSLFADGNIGSRRGESLGSQHGRMSTGMKGQSSSQTAQFNHSINNFIEAPIDELLDELRAGGDFEGFHSMGLDDEEFDSLRQEITLSKVCSVPAEHSNVRYSSQHLPAKTQVKIFTLTAPYSAVDEQHDSEIVIGVLDSDEKRLLVLTLFAKTHKTAILDMDDQSNAEKDITVTLGPVKRATGVIDACRLDDGNISRILVLAETPDGFGELSIQAPWSDVMKVTLPGSFTVSNIRDLGHDATPLAKREGGFKRVLSRGPRSLCGLRNAKSHGCVDVVDNEGKMHQLQIALQPRNPHALKIINVCRSLIPRGGEGVLVAWWKVMQWLRLESIEAVDVEWTALVIVLFSIALSFGKITKLSQGQAKKKPRTGALRSSSGAQSDLESWEIMQQQEASNGNPAPSWAQNQGWKWLSEELGDGSNAKTDESLSSIFAAEDDSTKTFLQRHVELARQFTGSTLGQSTLRTTLPISQASDNGKEILVDVLVGLHLLREEQKLDTMTSDSFSSGVVSLTPILFQLVKWLGWSNWADTYDVEETALLDLPYDKDSPIENPPLEPLDCPSVYGWIESSLIDGTLTPFTTIPSLVSSRFSNSQTFSRNLNEWSSLTPRTLLFYQFFSLMRKDWSASQFVEALSASGIDGQLLETLPEAVLAPLQEAIVHCQTEPPRTWSKKLLALVGREDVNILLSPGQKLNHPQSSLLAPSHQSNLDIHTICASTFDAQESRLKPFDGSAEVDRHAITRSIFKDDQRMEEAERILETSSPTIAKVKSEPQWTESELLEAQKEHAQMLAYRTLAIPSGRGLLHFSARVPLLTQKITIYGFNLSCVMKPDNNTVGVEKSAFTEEKVCWAFFHTGVAAGVAVSREARGIDTSWILYNKSGPELSNRHAGFLLALGLNGHLKSVAKWVAFKYLTPKHTMTSIGLLLGLAASYIGTMDSLITRLLSVHVTRMLPPGAAELNLSPLTQTTGIMGIGLLYCKTQHRRMSEIMVSEIEHIDTETDEEPLRNEGYRLAAGFALGYINLGKGSDLKGLHDMRLTERLLILAAGNKKVDLVHVLDKATAASVVAIALIFMKSENQVLARKIDVPDSLLQFDYVRPDIFLLRTLARHLIMWSKIQPSLKWVKANLPESYRKRSSLELVKSLTSDDLPFYNIVTGLCFSVALRFAGSGSSVARDLLIHYLDQLIRICQIDANTFDKKLTRNTVRNCLDLLALAAATVMAGTGDLVVFRRLRSMHGRDDNETPYGSHLAAHLAIGALFLGGGTFTFGTSNLAVASLLVAFYPIFPSTVQDNKSHLQAFRHFWVLAAEARCLVTKDIDTNRPVPIPIIVTLRTGEQRQLHTPCLLPELDQIKSVKTDSPEYWNVTLDFATNQTHIASFKSTQTILVRRRPAHDSTSSAFQATLQALNDIDDTLYTSMSTTPQPQSLAWIFELPAFATLTKAEIALVLPSDPGGASDLNKGTRETAVDARLMFEGALESGKRDRLLGLRLLFRWAEREVAEGREGVWVRREVVERLKANVWMAAEGE